MDFEFLVVFACVFLAVYALVNFAFDVVIFVLKAIKGVKDDEEKKTF